MNAARMAVSLCVLLLGSCLSPCALATIDTKALSATTTYTLTNIARAHTSAISCAGSSASSSSGGSSSSSASSNSAAYQAAAAACAKAVADGLTTASGKCTKADVSSYVSVAATACAKATLSLRTKALATAVSKGQASAYASACATASGSSAAFAKAIATAYSKALASNGKGCAAYTDLNGEAKVSAVGKAIAQGLASSYAYAASSGKGATLAVTTALFTADVATYAKAIGQLFAYGCSSCPTDAWKQCKYCSQLQDGDDSSSNTLAVSAKGRYALAQAFSDAISAVCKKQLSIKAATQACLEAIGNVCVQITATTKGYLTASGNALSCTNSFVIGSATGISESYGSLVAEAVATAFKGDDCTSRAFSAVTVDTFAKIKLEDVVKAFNKACVASKGGKSVSYSVVAEALDLQSNQAFSNAISNAIATVESVCECSGAGYCCNCDTRSPQCPF